MYLLIIVQEILDSLYPPPSSSVQHDAQQPQFIEASDAQENKPLNFEVETRFRRKSAVSGGKMEHPWNFTTPHDASAEARVCLFLEWLLKQPHTLMCLLTSQP
jgi:hypothetical protein